MYCTQCGAQVSGADICDKCSAVKRRNRNSVLLIAIILIAAVAAAAVFIIKSRSGGEKAGIDYFYGVLDYSVIYYQEKSAALIDGIPIFRSVKETFKTSASHEIGLVGGGILLNNDVENKILNGLVTIDGLPASIEFFITDEKLIVGSPSLFYAEADINALGVDISEFTLKNGLHYYGEMIERVLRLFDVSYSGITDFEFFQPTEEIKAITAQYKDISKNLLDISVYEQYEGNIRIGGEIEDCEVISLTADRDTLLNWLNNELLPVLSVDAELNGFLDGLSFVTGGVIPDYERLMLATENYAADIEAAEADYAASVKFYVIDGIIVSFESEFAEVSAVGGDNRLDNVSLSFMENSVSWDVTLGEIELVLNGIGEFGIKAGDLLLPEDRYMPITSWHTTDLVKPVSVPETTLTFKDTTLVSLIGMLGEVMSYRGE